jgi:hypothetical protein
MLFLKHILAPSCTWLSPQLKSADGGKLTDGGCIEGLGQAPDHTTVAGQQGVLTGGSRLLLTLPLRDQAWLHHSGNDLFQTLSTSCLGLLSTCCLTGIITA